MMRKPAAAKAKAASVNRSSRRAATRSPSPATKRTRSATAADFIPAVAPTTQDTAKDAAIRKQLEEALARAVAAEARESMAKEQAQQARDECREATSMAEKCAERAASAEGQLKMLKEVYDQMHEAYTGSMSIIKSVAAALPCDGTAGKQSQLMLEAPNENSADNMSQVPGTPRVRSLSPSPLRSEPSPIAPADSSVMSSLLNDAVRTVRSGTAAAKDNTEADSGQGASGRRSGIDQTPTPSTPLRQPKPTPEKTRGSSRERLPQTPMNFTRRVPNTPTSLPRAPSREMLLNDKTANASNETDAPRGEKSDPKQVLSTMTCPKTINEWGQVQSKVWAGHSSLPKEWLRIWSQSHDTVYYLNLSNRKTTFDIKEVK